jgi:TPR repeat protein
VKEYFNKFLGTAFGLLLCVSRASAQSTKTSAAPANPRIESCPSKGIDPALLARAKAGDGFAQYSVGYCYEEGKGVQQDFGSAAEWYQKASEQGLAIAQWPLGLLYEQGQGVPQDYEKAYFWLSLAASAYSEQNEGVLRRQVVSARNDAARHLTKTKLIQVQEQTTQFLATHPKSF